MRRRGRCGRINCAQAFVNIRAGQRTEQVCARDALTQELSKGLTDPQGRCALTQIWTLTPTREAQQ